MAVARRAPRKKPGVRTPGLNLYYSSAIEGSLAEVLGAPNYSYRFAETKFLKAFVAQGITPVKLAMPEYYATADALPPALHDPALTSAHLIFRSTEQIRLLKFAYNIVCFAWEFDVLKDDTRVDEHPFLNQKRMLELCDEIWVPCNYTREVLERHGLRKVFVIPAPIEPPERARTTSDNALQSALEALGDIVVAPLQHNFLLTKKQNAAQCAARASTLGRYLDEHRQQHGTVRTYLSILNPEDSRKNLDATLRAFDYFSRRHPTAVLLVKVLTAKTRFSLADVLGDVVPHKLDNGSAFLSDNVVFFNDFLPESELALLYGMAEFYLCASVCEAQNLPLLEAMSHGVVPLTPAHTAMADYITSSNAVVIGDHEVINTNPHLAGTMAEKPFKVRLSFVEDIVQALERSLSLSAADRERLSEAARATVTERYSPAGVWSAIQGRLAEIGVEATATAPGGAAGGVNQQGVVGQ